MIGGMPKPFHSYREHPELAAFGQAVRASRLEMGLSQEALADEAGIDRSYMGGIERGEHNLALINIRKIASALNQTVAQLMKQAKL